MHTAGADFTKLTQLSLHLNTMTKNIRHILAVNKVFKLTDMIGCVLFDQWHDINGKVKCGILKYLNMNRNIIVAL